jgi:hypothetical protein
LQIPKGHVGVKKKLLADDKTTGPNDLLHSTNDVCGVLLKDSPFNLILVKKNMIVRAIFVLVSNTTSWLESNRV